MMFDDFFNKYEADLAIGKRNISMKMALENLLGFGGHILVETGCVRMDNDWGGGMSTLVFGDFCKTFNHHLFTVDNSHESLTKAKEITKDMAVFITYVENDSVEFLKTFNQKIDLLYLDSMDVPEYDSPESVSVVISQLHQLREMEAAYDKLADNPVILLDDNHLTNGGKTRLTKFFLKEKGFREVYSQKQSLWIRSQNI